MKKIVNSKNAPAPIGPYSHSVMAAGNLLFVSGQIPFDKDGKLAGDDIVAQTHQSIKNIEAIVAEAGGKLSDVVKTTVLLKDMNDFGKMNEVISWTDVLTFLLGIHCLLSLLSLLPSG